MTELTKKECCYLYNLAIISQRNNTIEKMCKLDKAEKVMLVNKLYNGYQEV